MKQMVHPLANGACCLANCTFPQRRPGIKRQNGAVAVMFVGSLTAIIGFLGLALDLSRVYNRKIEMQGVADTIALAAAEKLNGKSSGVSNALAAAQDIMQVGSYKPRYNYTQPMDWSDAAIKFGRSVNGSTVWLDAGEATASPDDVIYVKVDTNALDAAYGRVDMLFMPVVSSTLTSVSVSHAAVAGRSRLSVTPLAICAMSDTPQAPRPNASGNVELVEWGFRRGVSYDLMNMNYKGSAPANFLVDPIAAPGPGSSSTNFALSTVAPYVCTGTVALPKVSNASVSVQSGFPLASLFIHLNSRFDVFDGQCEPNAAPPDTNVRQYTAGAAGNVGWMSPKPTLPRAKPSATTTSPPGLQTIADLPSPNNQLPGNYGPLWANARAVPWSSAGQTEPAAGYPPFAATAAIWTSLYATGPGLSAYPAGATATPYSAGGAFAQVPSLAHRPGIKNRRVLNIPLLACPVTGSVATVVGIGKFFMTIPADANIISAEFAGLASEHQLGGPVEITQ
jgi:Flp pilus assembly protein TadG